MTLQEMLTRARASGQMLSPSEAAVLFAAAVRLAAARGATLRPRLVQIDEAGGMHLLPFDEAEPESEPSYLAPELLAEAAPRKSEPRVQVYAAGALGYEILTGTPAPQRAPGPELSGPLGDIVRIALSHDRRERFGDLSQLQDALADVQARPPAEGERNILVALRTRFSKRPPEKEAVARLIEKVSALEQQLAKAQARTESVRESLERFEEGDRRRAERKRPSVFFPGFLAGLLGAAAVLGAAWASGFVVQRNADGSIGRNAQGPAPATEGSVAAGARDAVQPNAAAPAARPRPPPPEAAPQPAPVPEDSGASQRDEPPPTAAATVEVTDAGATTPVRTDGSDAGGTASPPPAAPQQSPPPAGNAQHTAAAEPPARTSSAPARASRRAGVSPAAMNHALALSQVRRGETALERGSADEALSSFRAALENDPNIATAYRGLGMAYGVQGNDAEALQAYERYLQLSPSAADAADVRRSMAEIRDRGKLGEQK